MARQLGIVASLQGDIRDHEDSHRSKDMTISDLERAHGDKERIIREHLLNINSLGNKLSLLEQAHLNKDGVIQNHINSHNQKNGLLQDKESNVRSNISSLRGYL